MDGPEQFELSPRSMIVYTFREEPNSKQSDLLDSNKIQLKEKSEKTIYSMDNYLANSIKRV